MQHKNKLNRIIELLETGQTVFGTFASTGNVDDTVSCQALGYDFIIYEMEHSGFDFPNLRTAMQFLARPQTTQSSLTPATVPIVRIPAKASEPNQWIIKQALDHGNYGLVLPHLSTVAQAKSAVAACRYANPNAPAGQRGWGPFAASRYWGISLEEYTRVADVWPLNPDGELFLMPLVESLEGVRNLAEILANVKGISAIQFGAGDLSAELGYPGQMAHPKVEECLVQVKQVCADAGIPCAVIATENDVAKRLDQGFEIIISLPTLTDPALIKGRLLAKEARKLS